MTDKKELWTLAEGTMRSFAPFYRETMQRAINDTGAPNRWFGLSLARGSEPTPLSVDRCYESSPYTARKVFAEALDELAALDLLERVGEEAYVLTDPGREAVEDVFAVAHRSLETVEPLPAGEMEQINNLLYRMVEATLEAPEPEEKWATACSRWTDPGEDGAGAAKMDQYLTDLVRYRDDAHLAAWKPYGVSGHAWEALTFIWRDGVDTAESLAERLSYRTYAAEDYEQALQDLAARGWVVEEKGTYKLTEEGKRVREEAEEATDRHFFVGWSALSEDELARLEDLLARAKAGLEAAAQGQVWGLVGEVAQAIPRASWSVVEPVLEKHDLEKPGRVFMVLSARRFEPEPTSAARLALRGPYSNPKVFEDSLAELAEIGILASKGNGDYELTEKARAALREIDDVFYNRLGELEALPAEPLAQLEGFLNRIVEACLEAEEPENKWCITTTHCGHPEEEYNPLAKIDQHLDDLNGFRDDAHLAAWKPHDVSGPAWEAFTFVWRNEANTAEALAEKLPFRGHSAEAYKEALAELAGRGWVEETAEGYGVTGEGQALRQQVEELTDRYFFAPWACLSDTETIQLHDLLIRLKISLQEMAGGDEDA